MTDRPIIFSAPMVRALLAERKTQTRRVLKPQPPDGLMPECFAIPGEAQPVGAWCVRGDRLWVREAWLTSGRSPDGGWELWDLAEGASETSLSGIRRMPSIHMPRQFSRLTLTVTDVRVQRLQDISDADAKAEGIEPFDGIDPECAGFRNYSHHAAAGVWLDPRASFQSLWNSLHGPDAWETNPWVVALTFAVQHGNIDAVTP